ncbi:Ig-like domain-containing protein [uncultured Jatrophihabitans sp.]|uniref:L,D-transpeptidase n=1 Tax=uncultured Jatrophihabitans sp. TaxID=1610747 RepID=UPI0035C9B507
MHRVGSTGQRGMAAIGAALVALVTLSACTSGNDNRPDANASAADNGSASADSSSGASAPSSLPAAPAAAVTVAATGGFTKADPAEPVTVKVANGTLTAVVLKNAAGKPVKGALGAGATSWSSSEDLGYSKIYTLTATSKDGAGRVATKTQKIDTVSPNNLTQPYLNNIYGSALDKGATYGVGMVVSAYFDEDIPNKAAATKALEVTTTPHVNGAWYWVNQHTAHWRPQSYYPPGTKVSVTAKVYGKNLGGGLYGQSDVSTNFVIGAKRYSVANAKTHQVKVYFNDKLVRTMPTSMGQGGYVQGKNGQISLWTMPGIYTVINHENPARMSSDSYGLPASSPYGYAAENVYWATKISIDGIYLHQLDSTVYEQGRSNVSHGCLNLNLKNAKWFYKNARVGDVVQVVHSGGPKIEVWQGGDWSVPWTTWTSGKVAS